MNGQVDLKVDWCSYKAAKYAVENWHYSQSLPAGKGVYIGAWEEDGFIGSIMFSHGGTQNIGKPYGLDQWRCIELTRIALKEHQTPVSRLISVALVMLAKLSPNLRLVVSYSDLTQNHHGGIYQASNWVYVGEIPLDRYVLLGNEIHPRTVFSRYGTRSLEWLRLHIDPDVSAMNGKGKYKYLYPLDKAMRRQIEKLSQPYPKRTPTGGASDPTEAGGSIPTRPLQIAGQSVHVC